MWTVLSDSTHPTKPKPVITLIMSSQRKSFVPCVVREAGVPADLSAESLQHSCLFVLLPANESWTTLKNEDNDEEKADEQGSFCMRNLREHEDSSQFEGPSKILCWCTICSFSTDKFDSLSYHNKAHQSAKSLVRYKQIQLESQTILEPTTVPHETESSINDVPLVSEDNGKQPTDSRNILEIRPEVDNQMLKDEVRAVSVNGTVINPEPTYHVTSLLQRPPNLCTTPTIAVPYYTNKYNPILDRNAALIASFNRFPYPTHAELSWLTAVSKHPEEQIKVWFTIQRLKQGITWSPEEVEEARKKMFNGSIPPNHQTSTVLPSPVLCKSVQPIQRVKHTANSNVIEQRSSSPNGTVNGLDMGCQPVAATAANQTQIPKCSLETPRLTLEMKRPALTHTGAVKLMPPPPALFPGSKKFCSTSSVTSDFKKSIVAPFVPPKGKVSMVPPQVSSKETMPVALPPVLPKERLPLAPVASTNRKRSGVLSDNSSNNKSKLSYSANYAWVVPHINRPTIIQTPWFPPAAADCKSLKPSLTVTYSSSQNSNGVINRDAKSWILNWTANAKNELRHVRGHHLVPTQLERVKRKSPGQMKLLEESFQRNSFPSYNELDQLMVTTRLSRKDIESWFLERRELRDDLEQALLNSMGSKKEPQQSSVNLLKNVLVHTQWPSPVESQKGFAHTDFSGWFRDNCLLQRKEMLGDISGCRISQMGKVLTEDNSKDISPEVKERFSSALRPAGGETCEGWRWVEFRSGSCELHCKTD